MAAQEKNTIQLERQLDISMATQLHQQLNRAMEAEGTVVLDGSKTERIDTAAVQLLTAFCRQAETQGRHYEWQNRPACLDHAGKFLGINFA